MLAVSVFEGTASVQRFRYTGWLPIYNLHVFIIFFFAAFWCFRKKLSFNLRVGILLAIFYLVGISGLFTFGLISAGIWWLILCAVIARIFYSTQTGLLHGAICLVIMIGAGFAVTNGLVVLEFDVNNYVTQLSTWITLMVGCVALSMFIFSAILIYQPANPGLRTNAVWRRCVELINRQP